MTPFSRLVKKELSISIAVDANVTKSTSVAEGVNETISTSGFNVTLSNLKAPPAYLSDQDTF